METSEAVLLPTSIGSWSFHQLFASGQMNLFGYLQALKYRYHLRAADIWSGMIERRDDDYVSMVARVLQEEQIAVCHIAADEARAWKKIRYITLPLLRPVILFNIITGMIGMFQFFAQAYIMTDGGPAQSSLFYSLYLYLNAFSYFKMGYASAMAWILLLIALALTILILKLGRGFTSEASD